jgi:hypothetical protein
MQNMSRFQFALAASVALLTLSPISYGAKKTSEPSSYADMCVESANMPKPFGESDLKGNPKLQAYCSCFGPKFMARAQAAAQNMGKTPPPAAQQEKEELEMRNTCRKQLSLPLAKPV